MNNKGSTHSFLLRDACCYTTLSSLQLRLDRKGHPTGYDLNLFPCLNSDVPATINIHHSRSSGDDNIISVIDPPLTSNTIPASCAKERDTGAHCVKRAIGFTSRKNQSALPMFQKTKNQSDLCRRKPAFAKEPPLRLHSSNTHRSWNQCWNSHQFGAATRGRVPNKKNQLHRQRPRSTLQHGHPSVPLQIDTTSV